MLIQQDAPFTVIALLLASLLYVGQNFGGKKGKSKIRHGYGTKSNMTFNKKYTQVHRCTGMNASSRVCS